MKPKRVPLRMAALEKPVKPDTTYDEIDAVQRILVALFAMPERERAVVMGRAAGIPLATLATILWVDEETAREIHSRGLRMLSKCQLLEGHRKKLLDLSWLQPPRRNALRLMPADEKRLRKKLSGITKPDAHDSKPKKGKGLKP